MKKILNFRTLIYTKYLEILLKNIDIKVNL